MYPDYLIHFNKNHSKKNGQFTSGDGDGDGVPNDHEAASKEKKKKVVKGVLIGVGAAAVVAGAIVAGTSIAKANKDKKVSDLPKNNKKAKSLIGKNSNKVLKPQPMTSEQMNSLVPKPTPTIKPNNGKFTYTSRVNSVTDNFGPKMTQPVRMPKTSNVKSYYPTTNRATANVGPKMTQPVRMPKNTYEQKSGQYTFSWMK